MLSSKENGDEGFIQSHKDDEPRVSTHWNNWVEQERVQSKEIRIMEGMGSFPYRNGCGYGLSVSQRENYRRSMTEANKNQEEHVEVG